MSERETDRIRRMVDEGTITRREAERLLAVLDEIDGVESEFDHVDDEARAAAIPPVPPTPPTPPTPPRAASAAAADPAATHAAAHASAVKAAGQVAGQVAATVSTTWREEKPLAPRPGVHRWLRVRMLAGEVTVRTRPELEEVEIERGAEGVALERHGDDWIVRQFRPDKGFLDRIVGGLKSSELTIAVPPGTGIDLDMKAGEVRIDEVPFVHGDVLAGEVSIGATQGIDFRMRAGELTAALHLTEGEHHLSMTAAEAHVRLLRGSSVAIDARVSLGEINLGRGFGGSVESGLSASYQGTLGGGAARFALNQSTGELNLEADTDETDDA